MVLHGAYALFTAILSVSAAAVTEQASRQPSVVAPAWTCAPDPPYWRRSRVVRITAVLAIVRCARVDSSTSAEDAALAALAASMFAAVTAQDGAERDEEST